MTAPTSVLNESNPGPIQRLQGYITPTGSLSGDAYSFPANNPNIVLASGVLTITCGFVPKHVLLVNADTSVCVYQEWFEGMAAGNYLEVTQAGVMSLQTDGATAGFSVSVDQGAGAVGGTSSGGSAPSAPGGVVKIFTDVILASSQQAIWLIDG
jgi:hypothetical protein